MSPAQRRLLALWALLLSAVVCLGFQPVSRQIAVAILVVLSGAILALWYLSHRQSAQQTTVDFDDLPESTYRQPVVLVCGDLPQTWPTPSSVLTVTQGCWIRVSSHQDLDHVARQLLRQRPEWGRQLSVMVSVCPQKHADTEALTGRLLTLRWQISQLRKHSGHTVPLVLCAQAGSVMVNEQLWQTAVSGEDICIWRASSVPGTIAAWVTCGGAMAMQQQVLMNSLNHWFHKQVTAIFIDENPDIPTVEPTAALWGIGPVMADNLVSSVWTSWLAHHTAMQHVTGWQPKVADSSDRPLCPDFILPLLPEGQGLTPRQRTWRYALLIFTLAAIVALLSSGWNNRQLLQRLSFDIHHYDRIAMDDYGPKAEAVAILREDAVNLDSWARNGEPLHMSLGLYQGGRLRMPVLDAIRSYIPPPPLSEPAASPVAEIVRLDSMSLFDSGKSLLKTGSTKMLIHSLVGIKAKPGWLIVVAGHTDNTGNPELNQTLSLKRAEAVRDWMRDTGDVPESCFAVQGYGESRPVATNDTADGRTLNRRVEISLVPQADACLVPAIPLTLSQDDDVTDNNME